MEISKSTPYVRYRENISSTLHKGTIHIESEYLDRERKTTIESIEGQTWQNMVNGENKEEDILPRLGLKIEGNEDILDSKEQHMPIDTIIGDVEPVANEDGTYTYEISTMEGSYAKTLDGENNFSLTSDGLVGDMYIKYNAQGEEVNGSIVMDNWQSSYTIENSNNGEIKNAFLKGNTLVNLFKNKVTHRDTGKFIYVEEGDKIQATFEDGVTSGWMGFSFNENVPFEIGKTYTVMNELYKCDDQLTGFNISLGNKTFNNTKPVIGINKFKIIIPSDYTEGENWMYYDVRNTNNSATIFSSNLLILEGDYTQEDIPYFEGIQSVKMPSLMTNGKNLWDGKSIADKLFTYGVAFENDMLYFPVPPVGSSNTYTTKPLLEGQFKPNTQYILSCPKSEITEPNADWSIHPSFIYTDGTKNGTYLKEGKSVVSSANKTIDHIEFNNPWRVGGKYSFQLEEGTVATSYEPYKSTTLSTPKDVTLRKIGDIQDELDLETGTLTQRIGEVVFDGNEDWTKPTSQPENTTRFLLTDFPNIKNTIINSNFKVKGSSFGDEIGIWCDTNTIINVDKSIDTIESFKASLSQNPITVQYTLATPNITQIDLTIKDQDNKIIQSLHTHPSTTHVNLSSDGLIPNAELSYTMYGNIGETTGEKITDGTDSKLIEGKVYGDTLLNVLPSPSLKNSMDYNTSMQKLNDGYDNVNVVDGEFKKATLYGQTLVNLINLEKFTSDSNMLYTYELPVKNNTTYTVIATLKGSDKIDSTRESVLRIKSNDNNGSELIGTQQIEPNNTSAVINIFSTIEVTTQNNLHIRLFNTLPKNLKMLIIEGDYTNQDIPYFEGMQSVKMPSVKTCGKNLFHSDIQVFNNSNYIRTGNDTNNVCDTELKPSTTYALSWNGNNRDGKIRLYSNGIKTNSIDIGWHKSSVTFTTSEVENGFSFYTQLSEDSSLTSDMSFNVQLEEGSTATPYEPYQSNTLATPEDVTLRAIGDVRDELDCVTEELTQRIGEIVLDGSQDGEYNHTYDESLGILTIRLPKITNIKNDGVNLFGLLSDKYVSVTNKSPNNIMAYNGRIMITKPISELESFSTSDKIKSFLSQNPITLQYPLQTPITETINPTITDQDSQPQTALHTIANGYINTSSQGLIPSVNYEVPTSNSYYLDLVKPNTQYTTKSSSDCNATIDGVTYSLSANGTFTTPSTITDNLMVLDAQVDDLMFIEGDLTGRELDYFTGLQSVESVNVSVYPSDLDNINFMGMIEWENDYPYLYRLPVKGQRLWYKTGNMWNYIRFYDKNKQFLGEETNSGMGGSYQIKGHLLNKDIISKAVYFSINKKSPAGNVQIMQLRTKNNLPDIPYTDNIINLTTHQPIVLHGIGDVKDELDLVNECVVRRIGKVVIDDTFTNDWKISKLSNGTIVAYRSVSTGEPNYYTLIKNYGFPNGLDNKNSLCNVNLASSVEDSTYNYNDVRIYFHAWFGNYHMKIIFPSVYNFSTSQEVNNWLKQNPIIIQAKRTTPITEPVRIVPQNPKQSTTSLTLQSPLQKVGNVADQLRWNPYKGHYVRYNYIQDGVANSTYTFEDLKDMNERKFVNLYNQRTYIDTDHTVQVNSHGISRYCLAEQGKQYQVRWDWVEQPSVDTIKVDLCGNVKEIPSTDNSVVIDVEKFTHQFIQIQGLGLSGKITNLMVIETIDGEIPDVDFFSGIQCVGNTVNIDGNTKVQIDMEQTNGNLFDNTIEIYNNGNNIRFMLDMVRPNKTYTLKYDNMSVTKTMKYNQKQFNDSGQYGIQISNNGSANTHYKVELCYADMAKDGIRPRYYDKESIILPMKLCRVGNIYDNLYYDDLKGYYRIQQSIGHKYFTGETTEVWTMETTSGYRTIKFTCTSANIDQIALGQTICNSFKHLSTINDDIEGFIIYNGNFVLRIDKDRLVDKTVDGFKALLASNPIHLFYQLKTPQMINLTEYPNRIELNTYRDEIFTFFKGMNPTKFTLSVPMDKTYRYEIEEEGQGLANRVTVNNETISAENMIAVKEVRGQGIANIIEDVDNVVITPRPNHGGKSTSHTLNNTKPATIRVHGFEPSGDTAIGKYNVTDKAYQLKVMSSNGDNSLSDYYVLNVPYKLETYADGTKDVVYYDEAYKQWHFKGSSVKEYTVASNGTLSEVVEVFRGLAPRSGMIAEFKLMFTSGTTTSRMYYSLNGTTYNYTSLKRMTDGNYLYVGIFNTGGTKIDIAYKTDPNEEYTNLSPLSTQVPECFMVNQIQTCTFCEVTLDKQYIYSEMNSPIELDTYDGSTKVFMDGNATDTNIIIRNEGTSKIVNTYTDTEYTVYWKYVDGLGNLRVTLGGTTVEVDGKQEYATLKTQLNAPQELLYVGGYNLSIKDLMVVKGAKIDDLPYFEGSRQVGTLVLDEEGNKSYKITLVQGGSVLEQRDENAITFKDDNKHNVVVHKIVGVCPTKVD